jgi:hypothetical protein
MPTCPNKQQIEKADDRKQTFVPTPEWGPDSGVYVRSLSGAERDLWDAGNWKTVAGKVVPNPEHRRARMVVLAATDEHGVKLFNNDDVRWLSDKSGAVLDRIFEAVANISATSPAALEEAEKNSEPGRS